MNNEGRVKKEKKYLKNILCYWRSCFYFLLSSNNFEILTYVIEMSKAEMKI